MRPTRELLIVGGGTAGWLTAAYLARTLGPGVRITLVESPAIASIGVGEGSFPSLRGTLAAIGIDEPRFLRETGATFKQGIRFDHWRRAPGEAAADSYFHPFSQPSQRPGAPELLPYWLLGHAGPGVAFADAVTMQKTLVDAARAPRREGDADYLGPMNYAYHFDAGRLAALLAAQAQALGVVHVTDTVSGVTRRDDGGIACVHTAGRGALAADLFIDCSGFRAELIGQALGSPFRDAGNQLLADRALALPLPYAAPDAPIPSATLSTAQEAGWIWDIGLQARRGVGYVYSSAHTSDEQAAQVLRAYSGLSGAAAEALQPRPLRFRVGYREQPWVHNCVAVGLAGGFVEPLEASGIGLVETAAYLIAHLFPAGGEMAPVARHFNQFMRQRYERIVDFVKLHYALTQRSDSAFWRDNTRPETMSDTLREQLAMWRSRPPHRLDFITDVEMYPPSSWQYVLYGMGYATELGALAGAHTRVAEARAEFAMLRQVTGRALADLPPHRQLLVKCCQLRQASVTPVNA